MAYRIQFRRDTSTNWDSNNPILLQGEFGYELDTGFAKIGDGSSTWDQLTYFGGTGPSGPVGPTGAAGTSGGATGATGSSGSSGTSGSSGSSGTSGSSGSSGTSGSSGSSGTSGTSPVAPYPIVYALYSQTVESPTVTGTTGESSLIGSGVGTLTVPANGFSVGDSFSAGLSGLISSANADTIRIRVKTGSVILLDSGPQTTVGLTDDVWVSDIHFTIRAIGAAGVASIISSGIFQTTKKQTSFDNIQGFSFSTLNNTTFDTTTSNTLAITVQWGSTSGTNSIHTDIFTLNKTY